MALKNQEKVFDIVLVTSNMVLILALLLISIYLTFPLFDGKLYLTSILRYGSWALMALAMRIVLKRARKGLPIRAQEYLLMYLVLVFNFAVWFIYPINIIISIFAIPVFIYSYKVRKARS